ncbi:MAG: ABC transporter ATP-binding protein [Actinobacteria bacterium]|nr:ABC transporter ATP-binding protein [Actinomycetota bacterium]
MALLEVDDIYTGYGSAPVLHGTSFAVEEGETAVVLGLNGAGKTTTMMTIAGMLRTWAGQIRFDGQPVHRHDPTDLVKRGIVLVPEGRRVFPTLSVANNLRMGAWAQRKDQPFIVERTAQVFEYFPVLGERRSQMAGTLSGGEQQMLAIGRGLMAKPRLLLIDEASLGLSPKLVQQVLAIVKRINEDGVTVLLVEQNVGALKVVDRAFIMQKGQIIYEGDREALMSSGDIRQAYLGAGTSTSPPRRTRWGSRTGASSRRSSRWPRTPRRPLAGRARGASVPPAARRSPAAWTRPRSAPGRWRRRRSGTGTGSPRTRRSPSRSRPGR